VFTALREGEHKLGCCEGCHSMYNALPRACAVGAERPLPLPRVCESCAIPDTVARCCCSCGMPNNRTIGCDHIECVCGMHYCYGCAPTITAYQGGDRAGFVAETGDEVYEHMGTCNQ
jgi:hypothetical protein